MVPSPPRLRCEYLRQQAQQSSLFRRPRKSQAHRCCSYREANRTSPSQDSRIQGPRFQGRPLRRRRQSWGRFIQGYQIKQSNPLLHGIGRYKTRPKLIEKFTEIDTARTDSVEFGSRTLLPSNRLLLCKGCGRRPERIGPRYPARCMRARSQRDFPFDSTTHI